MKKLHLFVIVAALGGLTLSTGCKDKDFTPDPRIQSFEPAQAAAGRTATIEMVGQFADFDVAAGATADFGADITADARVASPELIIIDIAIANAAEYGPRTVSVTNGGRTYTLTDFFNVVPLVSVDYSTLLQGELNVIHVFNNDPTYDLSTAALSFDAGLVNLQQLGQDEKGADFVVKADLFATAGPISIDINDGGSIIQARDVITIDPVTITQLNDGDQISSSLAGDWAEFAVYEMPKQAGLTGLLRRLVYSGDINLDFEFYDDTDGINPLFVNFSTTPIEEFTQESYWIIVRPFQLGLPGPLPFDMGYAEDTVTDLNMGALTGEAVGAAGDFKAYNALGGDMGNRWQIRQLTLDATSGDLTPRVLFLDEPGLNVINSGTGAQSATVAIGSEVIPADMTATTPQLFVVDDVLGNGGATYTFDVTDAVATVAGTQFLDDGLALALDNATPTQVRTVTVTGLAGTITNVHLGVDVTHVYRGDVNITLESPTGTVITVQNDDFFDSGDDIFGMYPDVPPVGAGTSPADAFDGEDGNGDWIVTFTDTFPSADDGVLNGLILSIESM